jgi:hypothetical protein
MPCSKLQEQLAWGAPLSAEQRAHAAECPHCLQVATDYSLLDEAMDALAARVPATFADQVMAQVLEEGTLPSAAEIRNWLNKRWFQFALVYGGSVVAAINLLHFLASVLTTSVGLGGAQ